MTAREYLARCGMDPLDDQIDAERAAQERADRLNDFAPAPASPHQGHAMPENPGAKAPTTSVPPPAPVRPSSDNGRDPSSTSRRRPEDRGARQERAARRALYGARSGTVAVACKRPPMCPDCYGSGVHEGELCTTCKGRRA